MDAQILSRLSVPTPEEQELLAGRSLNRGLYMENGQDVIVRRKLLESEKMVTIHRHPRYVHFPEHTHDYIEVVYMCQGSSTHLINGTAVTLQAGDLLFLGQSARQEILPAGEGDLMVNFIARPEFFSSALALLGQEETPLREFIVRCLRGESLSGYLHFQVADVPEVQNLVENLLWSLLNGSPNRRSINQLTMGLLFIQLLNHTDKLRICSEEDALTMKVLRYVEENYVHGSLQQIADQLHYDSAWLSRQIKLRTGRNYTQLVQERRLSQAGWLLRNTNQNVARIATAVGYENVSYFHRIFFQRFGQSPRDYRMHK